MPIKVISLKFNEIGKLVFSTQNDEKRKEKDDANYQHQE